MAFLIQFLDSLVVRISACHVEGPGSIPGRGVNFALPDSKKNSKKLLFGQQKKNLGTVKHWWIANKALLDINMSCWTAKNWSGGLDSLDSKKAPWRAKKLLGQQKSSLDSKKAPGQQKAPWTAKKLAGQQKSLLDSKNNNINNPTRKLERGNFCPLGGTILKAGSRFGLEILFDSLHRPQPIAYFQGRSQKHWPLGGSNP